MELPFELKEIHDVFHVSQRRQYIPDTEHVVNDKPIELMTDLNNDEQPIKILEL
jgi:hypothetical protein